MTKQSLQSYPQATANQKAHDPNSLHTVLIRGYETSADIGVYESEQGVPQPIRISMHIDVMNADDKYSDQYENVICYDRLIGQIEAFLKSGHVGLVETVAERIADLALEHQRVLGVWVRVEKLAAIRAADSVGVELTRTKNMKANH